MSTHHDYITCSCGAQNLSIAFRCQSCGKLFDGGAGHTIPRARALSLRGHSGPISAEALKPVGPPSQQRPRQPRNHSQDVLTNPDTQVAIVTFSNDAALRQPPCSPHAVNTFRLDPSGSTNEAAGLKLAGTVWKGIPNSRLNIILLGDGEPTTSDRWFGNPVQDALDAADELKAQGARIATIACRGPSMDAGHLRALASSPALAWEAEAGHLAPAFLQASQSITSNRWGQCGAELVVLVIDESGSMSEENKQEDAERAVDAAINHLKQVHR